MEPHQSPNRRPSLTLAHTASPAISKASAYVRNSTARVRLRISARSEAALNALLTLYRETILASEDVGCFLSEEQLALRGQATPSRPRAVQSPPVHRRRAIGKDGLVRSGSLSASNYRRRQPATKSVSASKQHGTCCRQISRVIVTAMTDAVASRRSAAWRKNATPRSDEVSRFTGTAARGNLPANGSRVTSIVDVGQHTHCHCQRRKPNTISTVFARSIAYSRRFEVRANRRSNWRRSRFTKENEQTNSPS